MCVALGALLCEVVVGMAPGFEDSGMEVIMGGLIML